MHYPGHCSRGQGQAFIDSKAQSLEGMKNVETNSGNKLTWLTEI